MERDQSARDERDMNAFVTYQFVRLGLVGLIAILVLAASIVLIAVGREVYGLGLILAQLAGLVAVFFGNRDRRSPPPSDEAEGDADAA